MKKSIRCFCPVNRAVARDARRLNRPVAVRVPMAAILAELQARRARPVRDVRAEAEPGGCEMEDAA